MILELAPSSADTGHVASTLYSGIDAWRTISKMSWMKWVIVKKLQLIADMSTLSRDLAHEMNTDIPVSFATIRLCSVIHSLSNGSQMPVSIYEISWSSLNTISMMYVSRGSVTMPVVALLSLIEKSGQIEQCEWFLDTKKVYWFLRDSGISEAEKNYIESEKKITFELK
jgi:hypothetical protein